MIPSISMITTLFRSAHLFLSIIRLRQLLAHTLLEHGFDFSVILILKWLRKIRSINNFDRLMERKIERENQHIVSYTKLNNRSIHRNDLRFGHFSCVNYLRNSQFLFLCLCLCRCSTYIHVHRKITQCSGSLFTAPPSTFECVITH